MYFLKSDEAECVKGSAHRAGAGARADFSLHTKHIDYTHGAGVGAGAGADAAAIYVLCAENSLRQLQRQLQLRVRRAL